eukprot:GHVN01101195.1.p2 GENE.GHVN01101195.1~~GHVN01101195.1.p2  ORF type:complete len:111 (-),score=9.11 GHVN01101195.1:648-980(-)
MGGVNSTHVYNAYPTDVYVGVGTDATRDLSLLQRGTWKRWDNPACSMVHAFRREGEQPGTRIGSYDAGDNGSVIITKEGYLIRQGLGKRPFIDDRGISHLVDKPPPGYRE